MFMSEARMMFKTLITLVRGHTVLIAEEVGDQNALLILDQQMRDATGALDRAKKALAVAIAQESQEGQRLEATRVRIDDLETGGCCRHRGRPRRSRNGGRRGDRHPRGRA
jgi:hypothetical protein